MSRGRTCRSICVPSAVASKWYHGAVNRIPMQRPRFPRISSAATRQAGDVMMQQRHPLLRRLGAVIAAAAVLGQVLAFALHRPALAAEAPTYLLLDPAAWCGAMP